MVYLAFLFVMLLKEFICHYCVTRPYHCSLNLTLHNKISLMKYENLGKVEYFLPVDYIPCFVMDIIHRLLYVDNRWVRGLHGSRLGPGSTDNVQARIRPASSDSKQTLYRTFQAFSGHSFSLSLSSSPSFFLKEKLFVVALILYLWHCQALETNPTDFILSGIFVAAPPRNSLR
jgi:hypothetical protein